MPRRVHYFVLSLLITTVTVYVASLRVRGALEEHILGDSCSREPFVKAGLHDCHDNIFDVQNTTLGVCLLSPLTVSPCSAAVAADTLCSPRIVSRNHRCLPPRTHRQERCTDCASCPIRHCPLIQRRCRWCKSQRESSSTRIGSLCLVGCADSSRRFLDHGSTHYCDWVLASSP